MDNGWGAEGVPSRTSDLAQFERRETERKGAGDSGSFSTPNPKSADFTFWTWLRKKSPY